MKETFNFGNIVCHLLELDVEMTPSGALYFIQTYIQNIDPSISVTVAVLKQSSQCAKLSLACDNPSWPVTQPKTEI
jgi:hypothetical protein